MNGSEAKYNREYVEIKTALAQIRTKLDAIESSVHEIPATIHDLETRVEKNRNDISGIKATAAIFGGLAGSCFAAFSRFLFTGRN